VVETTESVAALVKLKCSVPQLRRVKENATEIRSAKMTVLLAVWGYIGSFA